MYNDEKRFKKRVEKIIEKYFLKCLYTGNVITQSRIDEV